MAALAPDDPGPIMTVRLDVEDHVTPVLRALRADLWVLQHGLALIVTAFVSTLLLGFMLGLVVSGLLR